jgi:cyclopropane fatty-acyl-phospholipid synthase-like methyltransferase
MKDYLEVEYSIAKKPLTAYPSKLAGFIFETFNLEAGKSFLEVGCGRCELLLHFGKLGLDIYGIDSASSARNLMSYSQKVLLNTLTTHFPFSSGVVSYLSTEEKSFH